MTLLTPEFLQTKTYSALRDRLALAHGGAVQEGVWSGSDFKATQRAAGATMSVDVAQGFALVNADDPGNAGLYHAQNDATVNVPQPTAAHATLPRIDQLLLVVNDSTHGGDATDVPALQWNTGTATSGATLDNRTGAAAALTGSLLLADVLVPAASATMTTANIRDRRPWARGANYAILMTSGDYSTTSGSSVLIDSTNLNPRIECSGLPVKITLRGWMTVTTTADAVFVPFIDGTSLAGGQRAQRLTTASVGYPIQVEWVTTPAAGSHLIGVSYNTSAGTLTARAAGAFGLEYQIEEIAKQNSNNS